MTRAVRTAPPSVAANQSAGGGAWKGGGGWRGGRGFSSHARVRPQLGGGTGRTGMGARVMLRAPGRGHGGGLEALVTLGWGLGWRWWPLGAPGALEEGHWWHWEPLGLGQGWHWEHWEHWCC